MRGQHRYDGDLQMFVQTSCEPDTDRLRFLRWLAERGRLEHEVAGPASGPLTSVSGVHATRQAALAA
jgi:hypothetical protein